MLAFAYDSRTKGNAATEIVKYFLQLHFGIKKDYRNSRPSRSAATSTRATDGPHASRRTRPRHRLGRQSVGAAWRAFDLQLTIYAALLVAIGLVMAYRTASSGGAGRSSAGSTFSRGLMWAAHRDRRLRAHDGVRLPMAQDLRWPLYVVQLGLLVLTLAIGDGVGGSARWVTLGPLTFQFSELAKILMIVVLANYLAARQGRSDLACTRSWAPACSSVRRWLLVMLQPDLGTSLVFAAILAGMLFMSGASLRWLAVAGRRRRGGDPARWTHLLRDYQKERIAAFLIATPDIQGVGLAAAPVADRRRFGRSGWARASPTGRRTRASSCRSRKRTSCSRSWPRSSGFIGAIVLFVLFGALLWRILVAGWRSRATRSGRCSPRARVDDPVPAVVNVGMVIGIMPITGIPLPFVTHGGASLVSIAIGLGILQSINIRQQGRVVSRPGDSRRVPAAWPRLIGGGGRPQPSDAIGRPAAATRLKRAGSTRPSRRSGRRAVHRLRPPSRLVARSARPAVTRRPRVTASPSAWSRRRPRRRRSCLARARPARPPAGPRVRGRLSASEVEELRRCVRRAWRCWRSRASLSARRSWPRS